MRTQPAAGENEAHGSTVEIHLDSSFDVIQGQGRFGFGRWSILSNGRCRGSRPDLRL